MFYFGYDLKITRLEWGLRSVGLLVHFIQVSGQPIDPIFKA
jgi:hypothetical protein